MGEVFRAVHTGRDVPVAFKVMSAERARDPEMRSALRREIRAVARLHHPGIIMVFDCGDVGAHIEEQTSGRFVAGSSWLAMELAGYSLEDLKRADINWWHVRNIFVRILDALSHSHARGVIHRDLKPGNVLFVEGPDGRHLKLTDFGLAHALGDPLDETEEDGLSDKITGTPRFMSPEQITGQWRDHGPWTDLYALGCLAYWLIDGDPPYEGDDTDRILEQHLEGQLPPLHAPFDLPTGFGSWLGRLLAKSPADRFQRAADAARALFELGDPPGVSRPADHPRLEFRAPLDDDLGHDEPTTDMGMTELISDVIGAPSVPDLQALDQPEQRRPSEALRDSVEIPTSWHRREPPPLSTDLVGVGLGLFGLREIPFVDRDEHRHQLWQALRQVGYAQQPQLTILQGATGTGKSRLANWICERGHELGAATPLRATHSPMGSGAHDGLGACIARHLRCTGLDREAILERVRRSLRDSNLDPDALHDCLAMTEIIAPAVIDDYSEDDARILFRNAEQRHAVVLRYLQRLARRRPLILFVDDLQWGNETLNFLEYLLDNPGDDKLPLMIIGTTQIDALVDQPVSRSKLDQLAAHQHTDVIDVGPLAPDDHRRLITRLLGLEQQLVERVARRTDGNPLYAVQLVGDWVERGRLELGPDGFRLLDPERESLPSDLQSVFRDRLTKLVDQDLRDPAEDALLALELAAVLGTEVTDHEWSNVCSEANLHQPLMVLDTMVANDLASKTPRGWSFTHQAFRQTLLETAESHGRLRNHHRQCADTLRRMYPADHPGLALRLARHLIEAHCFQEALQPLLDAGEENRIQCDFELARDLYDRYDQLLDALDIGADDKRRIRGWIDRAQILLRREQLPEADELLRRAETTAHSIGDAELLADALLYRARVANRRGALPEGMNFVEQALELHDGIDAPAGRAKLLSALGDLKYWAGDYYDAEQAYRSSISLFRTLDQRLELAHAEKALGSLYTTLGDTDKARSMLEDARDVFDEHGDLNEVAHVLNNLGEVYRAEGRLDEAENAYNESEKLIRRVGRTKDPVILVNLGMVRLAQDRVDDADPIFREVLELLSNSDRKGYLGLAHLARLPAMAHHQRWEQWDTHLTEARHHLDATGFVDADLATLARDAGERALLAGQTRRAQGALEVARQQWLQMGRQDRAAEIDRILPVSGEFDDP